MPSNRYGLVCGNAVMLCDSLSMRKVGLSADGALRALQGKIEQGAYPNLNIEWANEHLRLLGIPNANLKVS